MSVNLPVVLLFDASAPHVQGKNRNSHFARGQWKIILIGKESLC